MPLYEYRCHACGKTIEVIQKFSDEPLHVHEGCGGELEKLISPPSFQFKGSGWYVTDYGKGGKSAGTGESGSSAKSESSAGDSKGAESKGTESKGSETKASDSPSKPATSVSSDTK